MKASPSAALADLGGGGRLGMLQLSHPAGEVVGPHETHLLDEHHLGHVGRHRAAAATLDEAVEADRVHPDPVVGRRVRHHLQPNSLSPPALLKGFVAHSIISSSPVSDGWTRVLV